MTEKFLIKLAEYVGANEVFSLQEYAEDVQKYIKFYPLLFRIWRYSLEELNHPIKIQNTPFLACTRSRSALARLAEEGDHDPDSIVTEHSGKGLEPILVLQEGLREYPNTKEKNYILGVIQDNAWQKEVILLDVPVSIDPDDVVEVWTGSEIEDVD